MSTVFTDLVKNKIDTCWTPGVSGAIRNLAKWIRKLFKHVRDMIWSINYNFNKGG